MYKDSARKVCKCKFYAFTMGFTFYIHIVLSAVCMVEVEVAVMSYSRELFHWQWLVWTSHPGYYWSPLSSYQSERLL